MPTDHSFILKLSCPDRHGIVHAVSGFLFERSNNILDSAQFGDSHQQFFMRVHFEQDGGGADAATALDASGVRAARRAVLDALGNA